MLVGYARVSTIEQNLDRQLEALKNAGCEKIYSDKQTGANMDRPNLQLLFDEIKEGDTIIITDLTRFSRSTMDLFKLIEKIKEKKLFIKSIKDTWLDVSEENPYSQFLLTVMAGVAQLERDLTKMRQKEGIAIAKKKGKYQGRPKKYTENNPRFAHALELYEAGNHSIAEICKICSISESTFYRHMRKEKNKTHLYELPDDDIKEIIRDWANEGKKFEVIQTLLYNSCNGNSKIFKRLKNLMNEEIENYHKNVMSDFKL